MSELAETPIFIGGYPRSGTTLLTSLLDSHPDLIVYPRETQFFKQVLPLFRRDPALALDFVIWDTAQSSWYATHLYDEGKGVGQFQALLRVVFTQLGSSPKALLQAIMLAHAQVTGQSHKRAWVEKTPHNELFASSIFGWFPNAKLIYIVRDPRATFASVRGFQKIMHQPQTSALRFCAEWRASLQASRRNTLRFPSLTVKYEDLVEAPEATIERICTFLGIAFQDSLLQPTFDGADFTGFSSYSSFATQFKTIDRSSLGKWKEILPPNDIRTINYLLAEDLAALGYAADMVATSPALKLLYDIPYQAGLLALRAPAPVQRAIRAAVGSPPNRVDQYQQWKREQVAQPVEPMP
ncbi:MAG TPA: sulfotransferase [Roseiflexaceae bacterium]|nr:sulfotransferase [Roseiflexaceae bacterium]